MSDQDPLVLLRAEIKKATTDFSFLAMKRAADEIERLRYDLKVATDAMTQMVGDGVDGNSWFPPDYSEVYTDDPSTLRRLLGLAEPRCTGDPCICTNGIGCVTVPVDQW